MRIIRSKGGSEQREVEVSEIQIPDLWHVAVMLEKEFQMKGAAGQVLECWYLCHDMLRTLQEMEKAWREAGVEEVEE